MDIINVANKWYPCDTVMFDLRCGLQYWQGKQHFPNLSKAFGSMVYHYIIAHARVILQRAEYMKMIIANEMWGHSPTVHTYAHCIK